MDYEFVRYSPEFKQQIAGLRSRVFGGTPEFNAAYLEWKYEKNPYLDEPILHLALADNSAVGMRGSYGSEWQFGEDVSRVIPTAAEFAIEPEHRGRWVAQKLEAFAIEDLTARGHDYTFNTSPNLTTRLLRIRSGWKRAAKYQTFRRGTVPNLAAAKEGPGRQRRNLVSLVVHRLRKSLDDWQHSVPFRQFDDWAARVNKPIVVKTVPMIPEMCELNSIYCDASKIQHARDQRFYAWRLADPRSRYRYLYFDSGKGPEAFLTLQQSATGNPTTIVDWAASNADGWFNLLDAIIGSGFKCLQIASTRFSTAEIDALRKLDFEMVVEPDTRSHPAPGIFIRALANPASDQWALNGQRLLDSDRWDVRMICSDAF